MIRTFKKIKKDEGFVILFAVTLASILLAITLGVANIALKEINFSTSARDTNDAFFAADTGIECALYNDRAGSNSFAQNGSGTVNCLNQTLTVSGSNPWTFIVSGLGGATPPKACAKVTVTKDNASSPSSVRTVVNSKGYNTGDAACANNPNRTERELELTYGASVIAYVSSSQASALPTSNSLDISKPAGISPNNVLIASIALRPFTLSITPPLGWTLIRRKDNTGEALATYYKIVGSSEEPSSYTWNFSGNSNGVAGGIVAFSGVNTVSPIKISADRNTPNTSLDSPSPEVDTGALHTMVITVHSIPSSTTWTPPSGMLKAVDASSGTPIAVAGESIGVNYTSQPLSGLTGVKTAVQAGDATNPGFDNGNSQIIVLQP